MLRENELHQLKLALLAVLAVVLGFVLFGSGEAQQDSPRDPAGGVER